MDLTKDALIQSALPHARKLTERLLLFLEARLAAEIVFPQSEEERQFEAEAVAAGATLRKLTDEEEAAVDRLVWRPVAETCIAAMLHAFSDAAGDPGNVTRRVNLVDDDISVTALAKIASPIGGRRIGLDVEQCLRAAELTADLFRDRSQFVEPESLTIDGQQFTIQRNGDMLVVRAL